MKSNIAAVDVEAFKEATEDFQDSLNKHLKGYMFDSLIYRYKLARHKMTEFEIAADRRGQHDDSYYLNKEERDVMRFIQILDEAIGEHD